MSEKIIIAGHGARIELIIYGYENAGSSSISDTNWLRSGLTLTIGPFTGATNLSLETHDLASFSDQLTLLDEGKAAGAELCPVEEVIQCTVAMTTLGHALITGTVKTCDTVRAELSFSYESDLSFLRQTGADLERALERFPVTGTTNVA